MKGEAASSHGGSERGGQLALRTEDHRYDDRVPDTVASNDLEAKLKNAQRNLQEVQQELESHKAEQEKMKKMKKKEMPGGNAVQHALMQDLRDLRDYCVEIEQAKEKEEAQAKESRAALSSEQEQRKEDIRVRQESERLQAQLQSRIDSLTQEAKEYDSKLNLTSKDTAEMKKLLSMIQSERDETLNLLRRAVAQKEKMKGDRQRESQEATDKFERLQDNQKNADTKVRELLNSVDTLLGKFSLDKEDSKSQGSARSTVAVQLELMKIRDSIRFLLKANDSDVPRQTSGTLARKGKP
jgi:chromosome segregation ATPase